MEGEQRRTKARRTSDARHVHSSHASAAAPTASASSSAPKKKAEFLCPSRMLKFRNTLPSLPSGAKLLKYPFDPLRFVRYEPISLERTQKHKIHADLSLGIPVDLVDPDKYKPTSGAPAEPLQEDLSLLQDAGREERARSRRTPRFVVPWLRKPEYLTVDSERYGRKADVDMSRLARRAASQQNKGELKDKIRSIEATFEAVKEEPVHPRNPSLRPLSVLPIFPDFALWTNVYTQVIFASDPIERESSHPEDYEQSIVFAPPKDKGPQDDCFVYLLPKRQKRVREENEEVEGQGSPPPEEIVSREDGSLEYRWVQEYAYSIRKDPGEKKDSFFLVFYDDHVAFNMLYSRIYLSKLKAKVGGRREGNVVRPSEILVQPREFTRDELEYRAARLRELEGGDKEGGEGQGMTDAGDLGDGGDGGDGEDEGNDEAGTT